MQKENQDKYRADLIKKYEERSFECLANFAYYQSEYAKHDKQAKEMLGRKEAVEAKIKEIEIGPDHHTVENRKQIKLLREDVQKYDATLKLLGGETSPMQQAFKKAASWRDEGMEYLARCEYFHDFKLNTPEEIAEEKAKLATASAATPPVPAPTE